MAAKGLVALLMKKAPPPDKLGDGGSGVEGEGESLDDIGEGERDDGDNAALESAIADFFGAGRAGKWAEAASAYKEMHELCGDAGAGDDYEE